MALDRLTQITSSGISSTSTITVSAVAGSITGVVTATSLTVTGDVTSGMNVSGIVTATTVQVGSATTIHTTGIDLGSGNITSHNINSTGIITSTSFVGPVTGNVTGDLTGDVTGNVSSSGANTLGSLTVTNNATVGGALTVTGDLTVNGTTTTIDTAVTAVDKLEVGANNTTVGVAITQSGTGDILRLYDSSTQVVTVADGGSVGIGTDNPTKKLEVVGDIRLPSNYTISWGDDTTRIFRATDDIRIDTGSYERLRITSGGNIGIGTAVPATKLNVIGDTRVEGYSNAKIQIKRTGNTVANGSIEFLGSDDSFGWGLIANYDAGGSNFNIKEGSNSRLYIKSGNIGIGTDNPATKLHVEGDVRLVDNSPRIGFHDANAADNLNCTGGIEIFDSSGTRGAYMGATEGAGALTFGVSPSAGASPKERLRINSSGYVGVGTDFTPQKTLHLRDSNASGVQGNTQLRIEKGVGSNAAPGSISRNNCYIHLGGSEWVSGGGGNYLIGFGYSNGEVGTGFPAYVGYVETSSIGYTKGDLIFGTRGNTDGTNSPTERMRIHDNGYVEGHGHPIESGSTIRTQGGTGSGAATGWVSVASTTWDIDVNETHYMSCSFEGYIQSGTYWWTWRLYNSTRSEYLIPFLGANRLDNTSGYGNVAYIGYVHSYSRQPWVAFKKSASTQTGDTIQLQLHASSGGGSILYTNASQTLYARYVVFHMGVTTGGSTYF